jgi:hypothetical protein
MSDKDKDETVTKGEAVKSIYNFAQKGSLVALLPLLLFAWQQMSSHMELKRKNEQARQGKITELETKITVLETELKSSGNMAQWAKIRQMDEQLSSLLFDKKVAEAVKAELAKKKPPEEEPKVVAVPSVPKKESKKPPKYISELKKEAEELKKKKKLSSKQYRDMTQQQMNAPMPMPQQKK